MSCCSHHTRRHADPVGLPFNFYLLTLSRNVTGIGGWNTFVSVLDCISQFTVTYALQAIGLETKKRNTFAEADFGEA